MYYVPRREPAQHVHVKGIREPTERNKGFMDINCHIIDSHKLVLCWRSEVWATRLDPLLDAEAFPRP